MMRTLLLLAALLPTLAYAEQVPTRGKFDARVRTIDYNPLDIVTLNTYYGVSTHIGFAEGEVIEKESLDAGDRKAWSIKPSARGDLLFVRPIAPRANTNLMVVTNKRLYMFLLNVLPARAPGKTGKKGATHAAGYSMGTARSGELTYSLTFTYPDDDKARPDARKTQSSPNFCSSVAPMYTVPSGRPPLSRPSKVLCDSHYIFDIDWILSQGAEIRKPRDLPEN